MSRSPMTRSTGRGRWSLISGSSIEQEPIWIMPISPPPCMHRFMDDAENFAFGHAGFDPFLHDCAVPTSPNSAERSRA